MNFLPSNTIGLKRTLLFSAVLLLGSLAFGQEGSVSIDQDPKIDRLLELYKINNSRVNYYTIQVGFGSYEEAEDLKSQVQIDFPQWTPKIIFDSPTYRVRVGNFRTKLEAERKFLEVRKKYPAALLLKPEQVSRRNSQ